MTGQSLGQLKALLQHLSETQRALETEVSAHEAILSSVRLTHIYIYTITYSNV